MYMYFPKARKKNRYCYNKKKKKKKLNWTEKISHNRELKRIAGQIHGEHYSCPKPSHSSMAKSSFSFRISYFL